MWPIVALSGTWSDTDAARELREDIEAALGGLSEKQIAAALDCPASSWSAMRAGLTAGPGILRFAHLPAKFWIRFVILRGYRFGQMVIQDVISGRPVADVHKLEKLDGVRCRMVKADIYFHEEEQAG